jgi:uncharacterized membrane protein YkvI
MKKGLLSTLGAITLIAGANIAYTAGAGYGTGQEIMQYFTSYGIPGFAGLFILVLLFIFFDSVIATDSRKFGLKNINDVFVHYCGKILGNILSIFSFVFLFGMAALMIAGAGAYFSEYFGVNSMVGSGILTAVVLLTCLLGLKKTVDVIGLIGPTIALFILVIGIIAIVNSQMDLKAGSGFLINEGTTLQPSGNWLIASLMFFSFCTLFRGPYIIGTAIHRSEDIKHVVLGNAIGIIVYGVLGAILMTGQITNATIVDGTEVPNLVLGSIISPIIGGIFGLVLILAIYTTAAPLIWSVTDFVTKESSKVYPWVIILTALLAFVTSNLATFSTLYNFISTTAAYVGVLFIIPVIYTKFFRKPLPPASVTEDYHINRDAN